MSAKLSGRAHRCDPDPTFHTGHAVAVDGGHAVF